MIAAVADSPTLLHAVPGRVRLHLPGWSGRGKYLLERHLRRQAGVNHVEANPVTGNVLVRYDPRATSPDAVLSAADAAGRATADAPDEEPPAPPVLEEKKPGGKRRVRIPVRGMDRDPEVARRAVERLENKPGVKKVHASPLTGRLLVEYEEHLLDVEDILAEVADVELPDLPGEDWPTHPLDPGPLIQSATRTAGAALGLAVLTARRLLGRAAPTATVKTAASAAGIIGLLRSFPFIRNGLRHLMGKEATDLAFGAASVVTLTFAGSPLGLAVTGAEGLILLREVILRRSAWRRYEERLGGVASSRPGAEVRVESGERTPRRAEVVEGKGTAIGHDGLPVSIGPGAEVHAGDRLYGGPFCLRLQGGGAFIPEPRPAPPRPTLYSRYIQAMGPASLTYAAVTAAFTFSLSRTFQALLLVNPRPAVIGMEAANLDAATRVLRSGVTVIGTRPRRYLRLPDVLLLDSPRVLADGVELSGAVPLKEGLDAARLQGLAAGVAAAAGSPWGNAFPQASGVPASEGNFDGKQAVAFIDGARYTLGPVPNGDDIPEAAPLHQRGSRALVLRRDGERRPLGLLELRPRLRPGVSSLVQTCRRRGVGLGVVPRGSHAAAAALARRAEVPLLGSDNVVGMIRRKQAQGAFVALVSDSAHSAEAFAACDLAIGLSTGRSGAFPARADLLSPDLVGVTAILEAGVRRDLTVRDSVLWSLASNVFGAVWGFRGRPGVERASLAVYAAALGALTEGVLRLRGGRSSRSSLASLADPRPERWGQRNLEGVLRALNTSERGLTSAQAAARRQTQPQSAPRREVLRAVLDQLRAPTNGILAGAALLALAVGEVVDLLVIGATIAVNVGIGAWQEHQAGEASEALKRLGTTTARVLRDGFPATVPARDVVPGDILVLAPGDRVAADARLLEAQGLEVDEAALTGESLPVTKHAHGGTAECRIVLEGSDVQTGTGRAVVVAVGRYTRLGATAAALSLEETELSPLGERLGRMLRQALPVAAAGGAVVAVSGFFWGQSLLPELATGVSVALAAVPEGLPLMAGTGQVGVARRLARRNAYLRRLSAVEALGRVDVACTDKTGTLTEGRLRLTLVADSDREAGLPGALDADLRRVLAAGALASPHPDAGGAIPHATDLAVVNGAVEAGIGPELLQERQAEAPFDPVRAFHATLVAGRLHVKGAPEVVAPRCDRVRRDGGERLLDELSRSELLDRARRLAGRGLRVLLVAEGPADAPPDDPGGLTALGFLGISDPLRPTVREAVRRCREAGVRVLMITGDHPATARTIAAEAGLLDGTGEILTGPEIGDLHDGDLDRRLERATVIARANPLDKVRIVEGLRRLGHTVAMTGDGVNDGPALRLADVGVAMGKSGTEVARQAAAVVLADDDFSTLVEALVEGRSFWRNMRRAVGLLLGGNTGELGLIAGASVMGFPSPLTIPQILVVNLITDALPALSVVLQKPEHRHLAGLSREGLSALDAALRRDVLRRGAATAAPALGAFLLARRLLGPEQAGTVAFGSIVATQLGQTLDAGWSEEILNPSVLGAVGGSAALLASALTVPSLRTLLRVAPLGPAGWGLMGAASLAAVFLSRAFAVANWALARPGVGHPARPSSALPAPVLALPRPEPVA